MPLLYTLVGVAVAAVLVFTHMLAYTAGAKRVIKEDVQKILRKAQLTKEDALLYRRAAHILNKLVTVTDLYGDMAADIVSDQTRKTIEVWMADYKAELDKV